MHRWKFSLSANNACHEGSWGLSYSPQQTLIQDTLTGLISLGKCQGLYDWGLFTLRHTCQNERNYRRCFLPLKIVLNHFFVLSKGMHICHMSYVYGRYAPALYVAGILIGFHLSAPSEKFQWSHWHLSCRTVTGSTRIYRRNITCKAKHSHNAFSALTRIHWPPA